MCIRVKSAGPTFSFLEALMVAVHCIFANYACVGRYLCELVRLPIRISMVFHGQILKVRGHTLPCFHLVILEFGFKKN